VVRFYQDIPCLKGGNAIETSQSTYMQGAGTYP
jgi:hypothetical protein